jgi:hypothetical protein
MMGVRTPETCSAVYKRHVINLGNCCIWLVDLLEISKVHFISTRIISLQITSRFAEGKEIILAADTLLAAQLLPLMWDVI